MHGSRHTTWDSSSKVGTSHTEGCALSGHLLCTCILLRLNRYAVLVKTWLPFVKFERQDGLNRNLLVLQGMARLASCIHPPHLLHT